MTRGRFITFEGGEGAGKSTQVRHLAQSLASAGIESVATREPGGSPGAEDIRKLLVEGDVQRWDALTEALLHSAARRDHVANMIRPALDSGKWVISDRFADSTLAYQGFGLGLSAEIIAAITRLAVGEFSPDLTLVLDLPVEEGLKRAHRRGGSAQRYEKMDGGFHERMRQGFIEIANAHPERCVLIDATMPEDDVALEVRDAVASRLGVKFPGMR